MSVAHRPRRDPTPRSAAPRASAPAGARTTTGTRATAGAPNRRYLPVLVVAAVLALVAGLLLGGGSSSSGTAFTDSASAGYVELSFPSSWQRLGSAPTSRDSPSHSRSR